MDDRTPDEMEGDFPQAPQAPGVPDPIFMPRQPELARTARVKLPEKPEEEEAHGEFAPPVEEAATTRPPTGPHKAQYIFYVLALALGVGGLVFLFTSQPMDGQMAPVKEPPVELKFFGRFHPVILHLPIGALILAMLWDIFGQGKRREGAQVTVTWILWASLFTCLGAVASGWLLAMEGGYERALLEPHLKAALALTVGVYVTLLLKLLSRSRPGWFFSTLSSFFLAISVGILLFAAHKGGEMTHGETFLTKEFPPAWKAVLPVEVQNQLGLNETEEPKGGPPSKVATLYSSVIQPILDEKCVECHGPEKVKGKLKVDTLAHLMAGGESDEAPSIKPGSPADSLIMIYIDLPLDDDDHMPPKKKDQLTADEIKALEWWVKNGASGTVTLDQIPAADPMRDVLAKLVKPAP